MEKRTDSSGPISRRLGASGLAVLAVVLACVFFDAARGDVHGLVQDKNSGGGQDWEEEDWNDEEEESGRSFLYKELVASGYYSDAGESRFDLSPRPPGSYVGVDWVATYSSTAAINERFFPDWLRLAAVNLHPRLLWDPAENRLRLAPQDFWWKLQLGGKDRLSLRVGQFVLPYGVNPILSPRQMFILPVEATDLGLKWDWGLALKGPAGAYDWEIAATLGTGESLRSPRLFQDHDRASYLVTGRIGTPTYWELQYGFSFLYGELPVLAGPKLVRAEALSRWRLAFDVFYKRGNYLMFGAQATYGQDGFAGDENLVQVTGGEAAADVLGSRVWVDWVFPAENDLRARGQLETVVRDLSGSGTDDTAAILELSYSLATSVTLMVDYRVELNRSLGDENDTLFFGFVYYGF